MIPSDCAANGGRSIINGNSAAKRGAERHIIAADDGGIRNQQVTKIGNAASPPCCIVLNSAIDRDRCANIISNPAAFARRSIAADAAINNDGATVIVNPRAIRRLIVAIDRAAAGNCDCSIVINPAAVIGRGIAADRPVDRERSAVIVNPRAIRRLIVADVASTVTVPPSL